MLELALIAYAGHLVGAEINIPTNCSNEIHVAAWGAYETRMEKWMERPIHKGQRILSLAREWKENLEFCVIANFSPILESNSVKKPEQETT